MDGLSILHCNDICNYSLKRTSFNRYN
jgi:hypothetical protein